jgi:hypothetical protein
MSTVHDPFHGKDVQISDRLVDRLRGKYAIGPHLPNGNPEFGWRQFQAPPIQHDAAARIEELETACRIALEVYNRHASKKLPGDLAGDLVHAREILRGVLTTQQ